jgi:YgiT-type zinc finger domain-containing protein
MKCTNCGGGRFERRDEEHVIQVAGRKFAGRVAADVCTSCGESYVDATELARVELEAADALGGAGIVSGETFRFMRHALGMTAKDVGVEFDVAAETISRWENEERPLDRLAWATLAAMVRDRLEGHERTREQLRAMREPKRLAKTVHLGEAKSAAR